MHRMTKNGQVTIPRKSRDAFGLEEGALFEVVNTAEGILFKPVELVPKKITMAEIVEQTDKAIAEGRYTLITDDEELRTLIYDGL